MSLLDEIAEGTRRTGPGCGVCFFIESRPPAEAEEWDQVMAKPMRTHGHHAIWVAMAKRGYAALSENPIINHRHLGHRSGH